MELKSLSATGIRDFLQCPLKAVFRYDRKILSIKNDHAKVGIAVHTALEQLTRRMLSKKSFPDASDYDFAVNVFMNSATEEGLENVGFYTEGKQMVIEQIDQYDPSEKVLEVEHIFRIDTPDGIPITGAIDKVVELNEDTLAIVDYKTSRNALTPRELQEDIQLSMYDLAASIIWPEYTNRLLYLNYVRLDKVVSTYRTEEDRETFREFLKSIWLQMQKLRDTEAEGRLNHLCGWCDYKAHCPKYAEFMNSGKLELAPLTEMTDAEFISHWENVSQKKAVLKARERELKMIATQRFMEGQEIKAGGRELYSTQAGRTNYEIEKVAELIPSDDLLSVLSVNKGRLDSYAREDPELKDRLNRIAQVSYNAPVYKTRAAKEEIEEDVLFNEDESAA